MLLNLFPPPVLKSDAISIIKAMHVFLSSFFLLLFYTHKFFFNINRLLSSCFSHSLFINASNSDSDVGPLRHMFAMCHMDVVPGK